METLSRDNPKPIDIPPAHVFEEKSGDRKDKAQRKTESLAAVIEHGSVEAAIAAGKVDRVTMSRYLSDGNYYENLKRIEQVLASRLLATALERAENGSEKMVEFLLPALDDRFDAGIRRQNVANRGALASILLSKALKIEQGNDGSIEVDPLASSLGENIKANGPEGLDSSAAVSSDSSAEQLEHNRIDPLTISNKAEESDA